MARKIQVRRSAIHGNGVFAATDIKADTRLIEYKGQMLTHAQADKLHDGSSDSGHTFPFTLNDKYVLDANVDGSDARWINHGCDPNCIAVLDEYEGKDRRKDRVFIESLRDIKAGEELIYNYGIVLEERQTPRLKAIWACRCGSRKCTGTMLQPKRRKST
jgi:SET domain-containing protein